MEREKSSSLMTAVETDEAEEEVKAQKLTWEHSEAVEDFPFSAFCLTPANIEHDLINK